jgi:Na+/H+ antiporter NhaD/arsenite permease-like protein
MTDLHHKIVILVIWALTYLGIAMGRVPGLKLNRAGIALLGAIALMTFGGLTTADVVAFINWPTILLLFGFFVISAQLRLSGFYTWVAARVSSSLGHPARFLLVMMLAAGGLSAVLNNDVVCLVFTPIVATALVRRRINPVPYLVALAIASNLGAAATLIGNAQDMMIGQVAHVDFGGYLLWSAVPVLFAMGCAYGLIWLLSRKTIGTPLKLQIESDPVDRPFDRVHVIKGLVILAVVIALFFTQWPKELIVLAAAGIHLASPKFRTDDLLGQVNWSILVLFMGLFVVGEAFQSTGYATLAFQWLARGGFNLRSPTVLVAATAVLSNLMSNAAAVVLLLKLLTPLHFTTACLLALANSFGGSLIIIGSVANIIMVQQARALGIKISFADFSRLGVPVTLVALGGLLAWAAVAG